MALKRLVQAAMAAVVIAAAVPASAQQMLKVGSTPTGVPFTFLDTKTNTIQGIMVDLITEIGKDAGFEVKIEPMQFSTLIAVADLQQDRSDRGRDVHHRRAQGGDRLLRPRSTPMATGCSCRRPTPRTTSQQDDLKGEAVGAQIGTAFVEPLKKSGPLHRGEALRHHSRTSCAT